MKRTAVLAVLVGLLAGCAGDDRAPAPEARAGQLTTIGDIDDFRSAFEADDGVPRLVLILGPT